MSDVATWKTVFRRGFCPGLSDAVLTSLAVACETDDPRLTQGSTTTPPPLMCVADFPCEGGCALGFGGAIENGGFGTATVGQAEEFFARACFDADQRLGEPAACRWFLNWFDDAPRSVMLAELAAEIRAELAVRAARGEN